MARACPIPQRPDLPSAILPVGSLVVPGTAGELWLWGKDVRQARRAEESGCPSGGMHTVLRGKSAAFPLLS